VFANVSRGYEITHGAFILEWISLTNLPIFSFYPEPGFNPSFTELQYVTEKNIGGSDKYIFASIDRKTISASFRINVNLSPDLTLQYWGQPFIASGKYYDHKYILDPMADDFRNRFWTYSPAQKPLTWKIIITESI